MRQPKKHARQLISLGIVASPAATAQTCLNYILLQDDQNPIYSQKGVDSGSQINFMLAILYTVEVP